MNEPMSPKELRKAITSLYEEANDNVCNCGTMDDLSGCPHCLEWYMAGNKSLELITEYTAAIRQSERAKAEGLVEASKAIQWFCDDPKGSESQESLALGLSRLLPALRLALTKFNSEEK